MYKKRSNQIKKRIYLIINWGFKLIVVPQVEIDEFTLYTSSETIWNSGQGTYWFS